MKLKKRIVNKIYRVKILKPRKNIPINFALYELDIDTDEEQGITIIVDEENYNSIKEKGFYIVKLPDWEN